MVVAVVILKGSDSLKARRGTFRDSTTARPDEHHFQYSLTDRKGLHRAESGDYTSKATHNELDQDWSVNLGVDTAAVT